MFLRMISQAVRRPPLAHTCASSHMHTHTYMYLKKVLGIPVNFVIEYLYMHDEIIMLGSVSKHGIQ